MVTACSTFADELLSSSPAQPALHLRLRQLEALRNRTNCEGESTRTCSMKSTTSPSEEKMERNHSKPWDLHHIRTWVPILTPAHLRTWSTLDLYQGNQEGQLGVNNCQQLAETLRCVRLIWRIPISQGQPMVPWTVRPKYCQTTIWVRRSRCDSPF